MLALQILIDGFAISALYALGATGFTLIFGVSGVLKHDLKQACLQALRLDKDIVRAHAESRSWESATLQFLQHLHLAHRPGQAKLAGIKPAPESR